jgi:hypothetical protein
MQEGWPTAGCPTRHRSRKRTASITPSNAHNTKDGKHMTVSGQ